VPHSLPTGKLPPGILRRLLGEYARPGRGVMVGPGIGADAAVLEACASDEYLIAKTDPITLVSEDIGSYAVTINANDIACTGGVPMWFTAAIILPEKDATEELAESIFKSISEGCATLGISLVGGHTEVTHGIDRPIVVGHMLGTVKKDGLVTTAGARPGDSLILTKGIAIEAVSVIAREKESELLGAYHEEFVQRCRDFVKTPGISVVKDAQVAIDSGEVHAMHDPTEGGLSSGLYEIAEAAGVGIEVRAGAIRVLPEAFELLGRYGLDPLGSIASGALVIAAKAGDAPGIIAALEGEGIPAYDIGRVTDRSMGVKIERGGKLVDLPAFERDEIAKLY